MSRDKISYIPLHSSRAGLKTRVASKWTLIRESPANQIYAVDRILISISAVLLVLTIGAQIYIACTR
ncbi:MAG: hypothetical protein ABRQ23_00215 [Syntrophomonadaceae bacterium]